MLKFIRLILNLILLLSVVLALVYSFLWIQGDNGNEPKVAFFAAITVLATTSLKFLDKHYSKVWGEELEEKPQKASKENGNAYSLCATIKKYDYHLYKIRTVYSVIFTVIVVIFVGWHLAKWNADILDQYDRFKKGEEIHAEPHEIWKFTSFKHESREELSVERSQILLAFLTVIVFVIWFVIRPFVIEWICKSLHARTRYVSNQKDFKELSEEVDKGLQNYDFLNDEIVKIVINNFTRITKEFYMPNLMK